MTDPSADLRPWAALALGAAVLAAGLGLARAQLPEWRPGPLPPRSFYLERFQDATAPLAFRPGPAPPRIRLSTHDATLKLVCESPEEPVESVSTDLGVGVCVEVTWGGVLPGDPTPRDLTVQLSRAGVPRGILWTQRRHSAFSQPIASPSTSPTRQEALVRVLIPPGHTLREPRRGLFAAMAGAIYPMTSNSPGPMTSNGPGPMTSNGGARTGPGAGDEPREHVYTQISPVGSFIALLGVGDPAIAFRQNTQIVFSDFPRTWLPVAFFIVAVALFFALLGRGRIDLSNAWVLAAVTFVAVSPSLLEASGLGAVAARLLYAGVLVLRVFVLWSVGESLLRSERPELVASLDLLRRGRLGPRGGRDLLLGLGFGAGLAGLRLALHAAAAALPGVWPDLPSLSVPAFDVWQNPLVESLTLAGTLALAAAVAGRSRSARWVTAAAALAAGLLTAPVHLGPFAAGLAASWLFCALLVRLARRTGLAALLVAAVTQLLLPIAVYALLHLDWLPGTLAVCAGIPLALLTLGAVGLRRPGLPETGRLPQPAFIRRIEEERRLKYEMDLLARMQEGLLPRSLPEVPGWQIAAVSLLATEAGGDLYDARFDEAGGLWIAVGDVAGHGYSCVIVQAMATAALSSFIAQGRGPAEVLGSVDRVIRRDQSPRNFISLALLRLDPHTGDAVLANAGHPFPFLVRGKSATEIELPGLPLGQGPDRTYRDHAFALPPGAALILYSDGFFESCDAAGVPYGFERPRELLRHVAGRGAQAILDALIADWRRHLDGEEPLDDTTMVVLKREP
jgi:sigma-B regulation protein RsbU (phosphoserine phosphatase)